MISKKLYTRISAALAALFLGFSMTGGIISPQNVEAASSVKLNADNFPNEKFLENLKNYYDANGDGKLSASELEDITTLQLYAYTTGYPDSPTYWTEITDTTGIEHLTSLKTLYINGDSATESLDLTANKKLVSVNLCNMSALSSVNTKGLTKLKVLSINQCPYITKMDITTNTAMKEFCSAQNDSFMKLKTGAQNSKLSGLYVYDENISTLNVSKLKALKKLRISNTSLSLNKMAIANKKQLTTLDISSTLNNRINLGEYPALTDFIADNMNLTSLDCSKAKNLKTLSLSFNDLKLLNLKNCKKLETLYVNGNSALKTVDLSSSTKLRTFFAPYTTTLKLPSDTYLYSGYYWDSDLESNVYFADAFTNKLSINNFPASAYDVEVYLTGTTNDMLVSGSYFRY